MSYVEMPLFKLARTAVQTSASRPLPASRPAPTNAPRRAPIRMKLPPVLTKTQQRRGRRRRSSGPPPRAVAEAIQSLRGTDEDHAFELTIKTASDNPFLNAMRGRLFLPFDIPRSRKRKDGAQAETVVVFSTVPELVDAAKAAGANHVGGAELVPSIIDGSIVPTRLIATPDALQLLTRNVQAAKVLGPKGLMPSEKRGTVTTDLQKAIREARGGLDWRARPVDGVVDTIVGRVRQSPSEVEANVRAVIRAVQDVATAAAAASKAKTGNVVEIVTLKTSQSPRIAISTKLLSAPSRLALPSPPRPALPGPGAA